MSHKQMAKRHLYIGGNFLIFALTKYLRSQMVAHVSAPSLRRACRFHKPGLAVNLMHAEIMLYVQHTGTATVFQRSEAC